MNGLAKRVQLAPGTEAHGRPTVLQEVNMNAPERRKAAYSRGRAMVVCF